MFENNEENYERISISEQKYLENWLRNDLFNIYGKIVVLYEIYIWKMRSDEPLKIQFPSQDLDLQYHMLSSFFVFSEFS